MLLRVDSSDLTIEQAQALRTPLQRQLRYLGRLRTRMERVGFLPDDPLYLSTSRAFLAVHDLCVRVHYLGCSSGVDQRERANRGDPGLAAPPASSLRK